MITKLPISGKWTFNTTTRKLYFRGVQVKPSFFEPRPSGNHGAVDAAAAVRGDRLRALIKMKIVRVGNEGGSGWGRYIRGTGVDGRDYLRAHLLKVLVSEKQWVAAGDDLGVCDNSGNSSGDHDHLECWATPGDRESRVDLYWELCWLTQELQGDKRKLNPYPTPSTARVIQRGDVGYPVQWVQWALEFPEIHGRFGGALEDRLKAFQKRSGLKATGRVDAKTHAKLKAVTR